MGDEDILISILSKVDKITGRKRIQKMLYILKNLNVPINASFFKYYYGPFSRDVEKIVENLRDQSVVKESIFEYLNAESEPIRYYEYSLTTQGKIFSDKYIRNINEYGISDDLIKKMNELEIEKLVEISYKIYNKEIGGERIIEAIDKGIVKR